MRRKLDNKPPRNDYLSPASVLERVAKVGPIVLDPCANDKHPEHVGAELYLTQATGVEPDGVAWMHELCKRGISNGVIYSNSPYGRETRQWLQAYSDVRGPLAGNIGTIALCPGRTDSSYWGPSWDTASAVCFWRGRLHFINPDTMEPESDGAGHGSVLFGWGPIQYRFCEAFKDAGTVQVLR